MTEIGEPQQSWMGVSPPRRISPFIDKLTTTAPPRLLWSQVTHKRDDQQQNRKHLVLSNGSDVDEYFDVDCYDPANALK